MKLNEVIQKSTNTIYDLSLDAYFTPASDKINTMNKGSRRKPVISLRHINRLKKLVAAKKREFETRKELMGLMYGHGDGSDNAGGF